MKQNKLFMKFQKSGLFYIYSFSTIICLLLILECGQQFNYDTESYITAWSSFSSLNIDKWRTPIYPLFLGLTKSIFGSEYYLFIGTILQHILFIISIRYFYLLSRMIVNNISICLWTTAFYAIYPCVATWNCFLITEPFAIYGVIFMMYSFITSYIKNSTKHIVIFSFWLLFLVFLRPAQIYILPVFLLGWFLLIIKDKGINKITGYGILSVCISIGAILVYSYYYKTQYGLFSPSGIGIINKYYIARMDGAIRPEYTKDKEFQLFIKETIEKHNIKYSNGTDLDLYDEAENAISKFGLKSVSELVSSSDNDNPHLFVKRFIQRFHKAAGDKLFSTQIHQCKNLTDIIGIRLNFIYFLLVLYPFLVIKWMINNKSFAWISCILFMLGLSHLFLIIYACQNVWDRLILPATPIYLLMIEQVCCHFSIKRNIKMKYK